MWETIRRSPPRVVFLWFYLLSSYQISAVITREAGGNFHTLAVPTAPQSVTGAAGDSQITVSFTAPSSNGGQPVLVYQVSASPGTLRINGSTSPILVRPLANGQSYTFTVIAFNADGSSPPSAASASVSPGTVPGAPRIQGVVTASGRVIVTTLPPTSNGGRTITGYQATATRVDGGGGVFGVSTASPHLVTNLVDAQGYVVSVQARNAFGLGAAANAGTFTPWPNQTEPGVPLLAQFDNLSQKANVSFLPAVAPLNGAYPITGFNVTATRVVGTAGAVTVNVNVGASAANGGWLVVPGLVNGQAYNFSVRANNVVGLSAPMLYGPLYVGVPGVLAQPVVGVPQPDIGFAQLAAPELLNPHRGAAPITNYTAVSSPGNFKFNSTTFPVVIPDSALDAGVNYTFVVFASNAIGAGPVSPATRSHNSVGPPKVPTNVKAFPSNAQVTLVWKRPSNDGGADITNYVVTITSNRLGSTPLVLERGAGASTTVTNLQNGFLHTATVAARNRKGKGPATAAIEFTPFQNDNFLPVPGTPNGTFTNPHGNFRFSWSFPRADLIEITMQSRYVGWLAMGISRGPSMNSGADYWIGWVEDSGGAVVLFDAFSPDYDQPRTDAQMDLTVMSGRQTNNATLIVFRRPLLTNDSNQDVAIGATPLFVHWALSPVDGQTINGQRVFPRHDSCTNQACGVVYVNFMSGEMILGAELPVKQEDDTFNAGAIEMIVVFGLLGVYGLAHHIRKAYKQHRKSIILEALAEVSSHGGLWTPTNGKVNLFTSNSPSAHPNRPDVVTGMGAGSIRRVLHERKDTSGTTPRRMKAPDQSTIMARNSAAEERWSAKWVPCKTPDGDMFYWNADLNQSSWEIPPQPDMFSENDRKSVTSHFFNKGKPQRPSGPRPSRPSQDPLPSSGGTATNRLGLAFGGTAVPTTASAAASNQTQGGYKPALHVDTHAHGHTVDMRDSGLPQARKERFALLKKSELPGMASKFTACLNYRLFSSQVSVLQIVLALGFILLNALCWYASPYHSHGLLTAGCSVLIILPATRNSLLTLLLEFPFDQLIVYHRWLGRALFVISTIHFGVFLQLWSSQGLDVTDQIFANPANAWGFFAWFVLLLIQLLGLDYFRRNHFNTFYHTHFLFLLYYAFGWAHMPAPMTPYMVIILVLYGLDRLIRAFWGICPYKTVLLRVKGDILQVVFPKHRLAHFFGSYHVGQYIFINFPSVSLVEWHPFSISSAPDEVNAEVHIRALGNFTKKLMSKVKDGQVKQLTIRVDGPYGSHRFDYRRYPVLMLNAGGIGVTPMISILKDIYHVGDYPPGHKTKPHRIEVIYAIWVIPEQHTYDWFTEDLKSVWMKSQNPGYPILNLWVYATREKPENITNDYVAAGRPDFDSIFAMAANEWPNQAASVFACGPTLLVNACWDASVAQTRLGRRFDFHHETFDW